MTDKTILQCQCGAVECVGLGAPFLSAVCYCDDCQAAAREIEESGNGPAVADPDGGTALCLIRNDKFSITRGADLLQPHRLRPDSATSRMIAACCNSAMFLSFSDGRFWKSAMTGRIVGDRPRIEIRLCTSFRKSPMPWPDDAPRHPKFPVSALWRVAKQWATMKLGY